MYTPPQVYFDVKVEGQPAGRIVIRLFDDAKTASQRFADLAEEKEGVGYRLSKFDGIFPVSLACFGMWLSTREGAQHHNIPPVLLWHVLFELIEAERHLLLLARMG